jgi:hypothetical protein
MLFFVTFQTASMFDSLRAVLEALARGARIALH